MSAVPRFVQPRSVFDLNAASLAGKVAIVTGAGAGLGYQTAELVTAAGALVVFAEHVNALTKRQRRRQRRRRDAHRRPQAEATALRAALDRVAHDLSSVDVLVSDDAILVLADLPTESTTEPNHPIVINPTGVWLGMLWCLCC